MTFEIDDHFLGHHKTVRAIRRGAESLQMWMAIRTYVAVNNTDGFIPDEDICDLPMAPKNPKKWLMVLVECGKPMPDGTRGPGLVDIVDGGWKLHDYRDHGLSPDEITRRKQLSRDRKHRWRLKRLGLLDDDADGMDEERVPSRVTNDEPERDVHAFRCGVPNQSTTRDQPPPDPIRSEDLNLTEEAKEPDRSKRGSSTAFVSCPAHLRLNQAQRSVLEINLGMQPWQIDAMEAEYLAKNLVDGNSTKPVEAWQKCLAKAITSEWNSGNRPRRPKENEQKAREHDDCPAL